MVDNYWLMMVDNGYKWLIMVHNDKWCLAYTTIGDTNSTATTTFSNSIDESGGRRFAPAQATTDKQPCQAESWQSESKTYLLSTVEINNNNDLCHPWSFIGIRSWSIPSQSRSMILIWINLWLGNTSRIQPICQHDVLSNYIQWSTTVVGR